MSISLTRQYPGISSFRKYAQAHCSEIIILAGRHNYSTLLAAVAPYLVDLKGETIAAMGFSADLCTKWVGSQKPLSDLNETWRCLPLEQIPWSLALYYPCESGNPEPPWWVPVLEESYSSIPEDTNKHTRHARHSDISVGKTYQYKWPEGIARDLWEHDEYAYGFANIWLVWESANSDVL